MTVEQRRLSERHLVERFGDVGMPAKMRIELIPAGDELTVNWSGDEKAGSIQLRETNIEDQSELSNRADLASWDQFRGWAISQSPRSHIFRGQSQPWKLASTFHRTWRKDLATWTNHDVRMLFGAVMERVGYPLQLGNLEHNSAIWSILQHHGYPTPMLDWTFSPFVAAWFAFQNAGGDPDALPEFTFSTRTPGMSDMDGRPSLWMPHHLRSLCSKVFLSAIREPGRNRRFQR